MPSGTLAVVDPLTSRTRAVIPPLSEVFLHASASDEPFTIARRFVGGEGGVGKLT
jgi:hypothetical protein